jgi:hypothetical protein
MFVLLAAAFLQQAQVSASAPVLPASPVVRIALSPTRLVVAASGSIKLSAVA